MTNIEQTIENNEQLVTNLREALKQVIYQNEMLLRWVNGAVVFVDRDGMVTEANDVALESLGWEKEELIGRQGHETFQHTTDEGGEYPWEFSPVFAAIEDGSSHHVDGDLFWKKDGSSFVADYIVSPIRDEDNNIKGASVIFRNLTELRMQEAKQIHGLKLESIGELAAGIAHEINTPVQFVGTNVTFLQDCFDDLFNLLRRYSELREALQEGKDVQKLLDEINGLEQDADLDYLEEEVPQAFQQTTEGVDRVTKLVLGLKGFAHSSDNETKSPADINEIIKNTLVVCRNAYKYVATCETEFGNLPEIKVYQGDIGQVLLNLVVNAAQAIEDHKGESDEMGKILIRSSHENGYVLISVTDTGGGIPDHIRERVFDPFFTTKSVGRGSGQGLAISRTIVVDKHNGDLILTTTPGKGSTFVVKLPVAS